MIFPRLVLVSAKLAASARLISRPFVGARGGSESSAPWVAVATGHQRGRWLLARRDGLKEEAIDAQIDAAAEATYRLPSSWVVSEARGLFRKTAWMLRAVGDASVSPFAFATDGHGLDDCSTDLLLSAPPFGDLGGHLQPGALLAIAPKRGFLMVTPDEGRLPDVEKLLEIAGGIFARAGADAVSPWCFRLAEGRVVGMFGRDARGSFASNARQDHGSWHASQAAPGSVGAAAAHDLDPFELTIVRAVGARPEEASWHGLAKRLSGLAPERHFLDVLKGLDRRGYLTQSLRAGGMDSWSLSPAVACWAAGLELPPGPLPLYQVAWLAASLVAGGMTAITACTNLAQRAASSRSAGFLEASLQQVIQTDARCGGAMAIGVGLVPREGRGAFLLGLAGDPRLSVRTALFESFVSLDARPSPIVGLVDEASVDEMLRLGMTDEAPEVRHAAVALAATARRVATLAPELQRLTVDPAQQVRALAGHTLGA